MVYTCIICRYFIRVDGGVCSDGFAAYRVQFKIRTVVGAVLNDSRKFDTKYMRNIINIRLCAACRESNKSRKLHRTRCVP